MLIKSPTVAAGAMLALLLAILSTATRAEGWLSRLLIGATSGESVSANGAYREACGGCHIAYRPHLLPAASWERLMSTTQTHFGERLTLSSAQLAGIRNYLLDNGAGRTADPLAARIMAAQGSQAWPLRLTEMAFFKQRHQGEVAAELWRCAQCHARAAEGDYAVTTK